MIIELRTAIVDRACAGMEDLRATALGNAFKMSAGAAWILTRLEEEAQGISRFSIRKRLPRSDLALLRHAGAIGPLINQIREKVGGDAIYTDADGYRLTPLGRVRIRAALKEPII